MAEIESNSISVFRQPSALTGWTKITTYNDYTLRLVSGTTSTGGTVNFSSTFVNVTPSGTLSNSPTWPGTTGATTLDSTQIPAHTHTNYGAGPGVSGPSSPGSGSQYILAGPIAQQTSPTTPASIFKTSTSSGGGGSHSHPITVTGSSFSGDTVDFRLKYLDTILAQRD